MPSSDDDNMLALLAIILIRRRRRRREMLKEWKRDMRERVAAARNILCLIWIGEFRDSTNQIEKHRVKLTRVQELYTQLYNIKRETELLTFKMSSGSESDDDYVPEEPVQVSEEESADEETNLEYEKEVKHKTKKRKCQQPPKGKKKQKTRNVSKEIQNEEENTSEEVEPAAQNPEEDKKREDDLWAKFLEGTDTKPKSTKSEQSPVPATKSSSDVPESKKASVSKEKDDEKEREKRIFEFAGETIVVENNMIKERIKTPETVGKLEQKSRSRGGLSSILGQLNKKNTLSTLEKSKLDWNTYKKEEGVEEEIANINKGKAGFLDRRDFLERTDMRQYELERDLRLSKRSKR